MSGFFFNEYPYTDFHELNLSFLIKKMIELNETVKNFVSLNTIKYADPIQWDITTQYATNTVVIDPNTGIAYLSTKPVPSGVLLSNTDYWTVIFDLQAFIDGIVDNLTTHNDHDSVTATFASAQGDWIVLNDVLYRAITSIPIGTAYAEGTNVERITIEDVVKEIYVQISNIISTIGNLNDLTTTDKTSVVNAINETITDISNEATARTNGDAYLRELIGNMHWIFIGDSYNAGTNPDGPALNPYGNRIISKLGLTESYSAGTDGAGFTPSGYLSIIQGIESSVANPEHITDIMVCGGYNDRILSGSDITTGISNFVTYCKTQYPNARIHVGCIGRHRGDTTIQTAIHNNSLMNFMKCVDYGATFVHNSDLCLHTYNNFASDGIHPNDSGQEEIANALCNYVMGGSISKHGVALPFTVSSSSIGTVAGSGYMEIDNNMISIEFTALSLALTTPTTITCSGTPLDMGIVSGAYITSSLAYFTAVDTALTIHNGTDYQTVHGSLKIGVDNHLYFTPVDTNGSGFTPITNATNIEAYGKPISLNVSATVI